MSYSYTFIPSNELHYEITLPWEVQPVALEPKSMTGLESVVAIGCYQTCVESKTPFMEVDVAYESLINDIDASDWLDNILFATSEKIIKRKDYYIVSGKYSDVLTTNEFNGNIVVSRIRVFKNYSLECKMGYVIMVKATCSLDEYNSMAEKLLCCVIFFTLKNDTKWHFAEELKSINLNTPSNISFYHPISWKYTERFSSDKFSYFSLSLKNENKTCGVIDGYFLPEGNASTKETIFSMIFDKLKKSTATNTPTIKLTENTPFVNKCITDMWRGEMKLKDSEQCEGQLIIYTGKVESNYFYLIGLIVPQDLNFKLWATGKRALDIILNSINNYDLIYEDACYK